MTIGEFISDFNKFLFTSNAVTLIVGIALYQVGAGFWDDILLPPISLVVGGSQWTTAVYTIRPATATSPAVVIAYGDFLLKLLNFVVTGIVLYLLQKLGVGVIKTEHHLAKDAIDFARKHHQLEF